MAARRGALRQQPAQARRCLALGQQHHYAFQQGQAVGMVGEQLPGQLGQGIGGGGEVR